MKNVYNILLDDTNIGTTELEKADAPMGVTIIIYCLHPAKPALLSVFTATRMRVRVCHIY